MCLSRLSPVDYEVKDGYVEAYKVITPDHRSDVKGYLFTEGVNVAKDSGRQEADFGGYYTLGFHCFVKLNSAYRWIGPFNLGTPKDYCLKIIKVYVKPENIIEEGTQDGDPVIVASELEIRGFATYYTKEGYLERAK